MTDIEDWKQKQAELGLVTVRVRPEIYEWAKADVERYAKEGRSSVNTQRIAEFGHLPELQVIAANRWGKSGDVLVEIPGYGPWTSIYRGMQPMCRVTGVGCTSLAGSTRVVAGRRWGRAPRALEQAPHSEGAGSRFTQEDYEGYILQACARVCGSTAQPDASQRL